MQGRVALVTGAGTGIGAAVAARLSSQGASVLLLGRREAPLREVAEGLDGDCAVLRCDIAEQADVDAAVGLAIERWGRIDALVNNAAIYHMGHCLELDCEELAEVVDVNLTGTFRISQAVGREMARAGRGAIVNISSVDGRAAEPLNAPYNTTKAGLYGLTRSLAIDLGPFGVRCVSISPGYVAGTPAAEATSPGQAPLSESLANWRRTPSRRMVEVGEVAAACAFLVSDEAAGISGADLLVDGGLMSELYALESVDETGWKSHVDGVIERIRSGLAEESDRP